MSKLFSSNRVIALEHVDFDFERTSRIGLPEAVFCEGKPITVLLNLLEEFASCSHPSILFTRLSESVFRTVPESIQKAYDYDPISCTAFTHPLETTVSGSVAVVSAGSADGPVTWEVARTLQYLGIPFKVFEDCGVAGLWRIQKHLPEINRHDVIVVVAGLEAALTTILGGLSSHPIIGVPTSVGYGVCEGGKTALHSMLACCSPGITVMNIDNGYGAACAASRILHTFKRISS